LQQNVLPKYDAGNKVNRSCNTSHRSVVVEKDHGPAIIREHHKDRDIGLEEIIKAPLRQIAFGVI
jgi:hypothetical protein